MNPQTETSQKRRAVLLDRDGTLIEQVHYLSRIEQVRLIDGSVDALRLAAAAGLATVLVTNQSAVGRAMLSEVELQAVHAHLHQQLESAGVRLDGIYFCPHHRDAVLDAYRRECPCRKPNPGMLLQAAEDLDLELEGSLMVGDRFHDVEAGHRAGCRSALVETGYGADEWRNRKPDDPAPDYLARDLLDAVEWFLKTTET